MRQDSIFDSIKDVAFDEPGLYSSIQKALNKVNEKRGSKYTMFDLLTDKGKSPLGDEEGEPVHINAREDRALGGVPSVPFNGTGNDDRIARLNPFQQTMLAAMGGSGNINSQTGLREFFDGGGDGDWAGGDGGADGGNSPVEVDDSVYTGPAPGEVEANDDFPGPGPVGDDNGGGDTGGGFTDDNKEAGTYNFGKGSVNADVPGESWDKSGPGAETGSGGKETNMGLQNNPMGLASPQAPQKESKSFLDTVFNLMNVDPDRKDAKGRTDALGMRQDTVEGQKSMLGGVFGVPGYMAASLGGAMKDANLNNLAQTNYDKNYEDLNEFERAEVDAQDKSMNESMFAADEGTYNDPVAGRASPSAPSAASPSYLSAQRPAYWAFEGDPLQQRTGAATEALYGRPIFRSQDAQDYYRRLAAESINPLAPPTDVDYTYLTDVLGRARPASNTVQAFLDALNY